MANIAASKSLQRSRIPSGRVERVARIGLLAGEIALGGIAEGFRRVSGFSESATNAFLTVANAEKLARRLSTMRGAAMKLGQMLSLEGEDLLPPEIARALHILRSEAHAMPDAQLHRVLGRAYGRGWRERFAEIGMAPVAAASIGQVHHALDAEGNELALKIQYPGVAHSIESDVDNLASVLRLSRLLPAEIDLSGVIRETKRQLRAETDYQREADNMRRYAALVADDDRVFVPRVHDALVTKHILAMDFVHGRPLEDLRSEEYGQSLRDEVGATLYRLLFREFLEFRFMQTDPNPANYLFLPESERVALLDYGAAAELEPRLSQLYGQIFRAGMDGNREAMRAAMVAIGFFADDERPDCVAGVVDLFMLGCEPFRCEGPYDFGASDVPARARDIGMELTFAKGFFRPPPPKTIFLHRKLGGLFLLCARLGARVDVRRLLRQSLDRSA